MGILLSNSTGKRHALGVRCVVGRAVTSQLRIADGTISAEHATIYFDGHRWKVRDLASRNGSFIGGLRIDAQEAAELPLGATVQFGPSSENSWTLEADAPPGPSARVESGERVYADDGHTLWLPLSGDPEVCVRPGDERWVAEDENGARAVEDEQEMVVAGQTHYLELPPWQGADGMATFGSSTIDATAEMSLHFNVSQDEEHVALEALVGTRKVDLGARSHNYPLLLLARRRQDELKAGVPSSEAGWMYSRELFSMLRASRESVNVQLWRATQCLKKAELAAQQLIERRLDSNQLRIGVAGITISQA